MARGNSTTLLFVDTDKESMGLNFFHGIGISWKMRNPSSIQQMIESTQVSALLAKVLSRVIS